MTTSNPSRLIHNFRDNDNDNAPTNQMHYKSLQNSFLFNYQTIIFRTNLKIQLFSIRVSRRNNWRKYISRAWFIITNKNNRNGRWLISCWSPSISSSKVLSVSRCSSLIRSTCPSRIKSLSWFYKLNIFNINNHKQKQSKKFIQELNN